MEFANMDVGQLFERLSQSGISRKDLSVRADINRATITRWQTTENSASPKLIRRAHMALDSLINEKIETLLRLGSGKDQATIERLHRLIDQPPSTGE